MTHASSHAHKRGRAHVTLVSDSWPSAAALMGWDGMGLLLPVPHSEAAVIIRTSFGALPKTDATRGIWP